MASSSSSTSLPYGLKYHVFISFRGKNTRDDFARHLGDALRSNGIEIFLDEKEHERGEEMNPALDNAIQESWIAVVIFCINYAYSSWCLEELAKVMEYSKDKSMLVLPIFYKVNPSSLRHEKGSYAEALAKHESRISEKWKIERWKLALHKAADISGWHLKPDQMNEHGLIFNIVDYVSKRISSLRDGDKNIDQHVNYHVFISFRGPDTRLGFTRDLYDALIRNEIKVFFDEEELKKGEEINLALEKAIQVSLMALVIFSINYADSSWCLEELAKVMEYSKDTHMMVVPIFYNVNPSDLHYDKGRYAEALAKHAVRSIEKWKIDRWKLALQNAADVPGWPIKPGPM
ncbi:PREDICTED: TMV resistance protein N-like [Lupinus angustifolius]|uniref:TMV resistance protein N-like n=1 Tax=Lupinus angustifolius TaxID=3871 RepID=UPI00092F8833|nr:PREDICTED: TMV resistance protein N-like [Lupinus angustifolius]